MKCTQRQMDALYQVYLRWQTKTPHAIMPMGFEVVPNDEYRDGDYIGVWVGEPTQGHIAASDPGAMYLGIEKDGHTHS